MVPVYMIYAYMMNDVCVYAIHVYTFWEGKMREHSLHFKSDSTSLLPGPPSAFSSSICSCMESCLSLFLAVVGVDGRWGWGKLDCDSGLSGAIDAAVAVASALASAAAPLAQASSPLFFGLHHRLWCTKSPCREQKTVSG